MKLEARDGKQRETVVAATEQLFRLIQSIPSPKAEPFKLWLAKAGRERIDEIEDPEIGFDRLMVTNFKQEKELTTQNTKSLQQAKNKEINK